MVAEWEGSQEDVNALRKDNFNHARTAYESLKRYGRTLAVTPIDKKEMQRQKRRLKDPYQRAPNKGQYWQQPSYTVRDSVDEMRSWLLTHANELPSELEDEKGNAKGRSQYEIPEAVVRNAERDKDSTRGNWGYGTENSRTFSVDNQAFDYEGAVLSKYEAHGMNYVQRLGCNAPLSMIVEELASKYDAETAEWIRSHPTSHPVVMEALAVRGQRYQKHVEAQTTRLRWRGMEEWDAVGKADDKLREGVARKPSDSNAKPLPSLESLREQFHVEDGVLMRTKLDRPVTGKQVEINKTKYVTSRIVFALTTGQDPGSLMVIDGDATQYRNAKGTAYARDDGMFDAMVKFGANVVVTVGEYKSEAQAQEACRLYLKSLDMGLLG
jgi:hypothetical protein